jgi:hypothetical protein
MTVINTLEELGKYIDVGDSMIVRFFWGLGLAIFFGTGFWVRICRLLRRLKNPATYG